MTELLVIDRIEGRLAVVEVAAGRFQNVELSRIMGRARDGALLRQLPNGDYAVDEEATARRTEEMKKRTRGLFR
ncbi:MAG: DUF3006 domain-containing protein [Atopobiaceae bacterium]